GHHDRRGRRRDWNVGHGHEQRLRGDDGSRLGHCRFRAELDGSKARDQREGGQEGETREDEVSTAPVSMATVSMAAARYLSARVREFHDERRRSANPKPILTSV